MIESGSLTPGVDPTSWGLPAGTALRYEAPAPALRPLFPSYAVLDSNPAVWRGPDSWILPSWAQIWVVVTDAPVLVAVRRRGPAQLGQAMLFGSSSHAAPVASGGGVTVVIDLSPIGWARLFGPTADTMRDQVKQLALDWAEALIARLHASDRAVEVKPVLDTLLTGHLPPTNPDEPLVARAQAALLDGQSVGAAAEIAGITPRLLLSLCNRYWGYGPKVLIRRTRFMRGLTAMLMDGGPPNFSTPPPGYHDVPHFLRDGNLFLGLTPRRFLSLPMPYLRAVLRARTAVLGSPVPMLD